jgi:hypothetical protein
MFILRSWLILGLLLALSGDALAAKAKKKQAGGVQGTVKAIEPGTGDNKDTGTITVNIVAGKKKKKVPAPAGQGAEKKITITKETRIEKVSGKKGQTETKPATFSDLQNGARLKITLKTGTDQAEKVQIVDGKKKKKKNQAA